MNLDDGNEIQRRRRRTWMFGSPRPLSVDLSVAAVAAVAVAVIGVIITMAAQRFGTPLSVAYRFDDILTGVIVGGLFLAYLRIVAARKRQELKRLRDIGEMNHHVRNALQVIGSSHHEPDTAERLRMISEAVNRIEKALKEFSV